MRTIAAGIFLLASVASAASPETNPEHGLEQQECRGVSGCAHGLVVDVVHFGARGRHVLRVLPYRGTLRDGAGFAAQDTG